MFQDVLDPSRIVKVIGQREDKYHCHVFFRRGKHLIFNGTTMLSVSLFDQEKKINDRIGFQHYYPE